MAAHGEGNESAAYQRILTGSQRADLFRVVYLRVAGGVYADLDEGPRRPLRTLVGGVDAHGQRVPADATAVICAFWPFEFMLYVPRHPIMVEAGRQFSQNVLLHAEWHRTNDSRKCTGPHSCVIRNTGPLAYTSAVGAATQAGGCTNTGRLPMRGQCDKAQSQALRALHVCRPDAGNVWNSWACGTARHFDCRNSVARRFSCHRGQHYSKVRSFFTR